MQYYLILLLLLPFHCWGQHAVIAATKMNVLYIGVENPVSFAVDGIKCNELTMMVENGTAKRIGECDYNIEVIKPGRAMIFLVKRKDTIYRTSYRVKHLSNPTTGWGVNGPYWFLLDSLRSQNGLSAFMENFDYDAAFTLVSYQVTVLRNKKLSGWSKIYCDDCLKKIENDHYEIVFSGINEGAEFSGKLKEFVRSKLLAGDKVFIEEIKVHGPDNRIRQLNSISFTMQ